MIDPRIELETVKGEQSFRQLAKKLGMASGYLCDVVNGKRPASDTLLEKLGLRIVYERIGVTSARNAGPNRKRANPGNGA